MPFVGGPVRGLQAKHLSPIILLRVVDGLAVHNELRLSDWGRKVQGRASRWDVNSALSTWPEKVVLAKLRKLLRRGLIEGCGCGCRGDYYLTDNGRAVLESLR